MARDLTDPRNFDVRTLNHKMNRAELSAEQLQAYLDSLPDEADEAAETTTRFAPNFQRAHYTKGQG